MSLIPTYNPVKKLPVVPSIYASGKIASTVNFNEIENAMSSPLNDLPFILLISEVFYFTINNKYEDSFQYLGRADEKDHKMALLALAVHYTEQKDYEKACTLLDKMIALDFGKDKRDFGALRWIDQLSIKLPMHLLEAAEKLREKILTFC